MMAAGLPLFLLPCTAEDYPLHVRGRVTGRIAGCGKLGGLKAQGACLSPVPSPHLALRPR